MTRRYGSLIRDSDKDYIISRQAVFSSDDFKNATSKKLTSEEAKNVRMYLENPTSSGIWVLQAKWLKFSGISAGIIKQLKETFSKSNTIEIPVGKNKSTVNLKKEDQEKLFEAVGRLSFIFNLFYYMRHHQKDEGSYSAYLEREDSEYRLIFNLIDIPALAVEYEDALNYFNEKIYFDKLDRTITDEKIIRIKAGFFIYGDRNDPDSDTPFEFAGPEKEYKNFSLHSIHPEPLETLRVFYEKLGKITNFNLFPIYSPEEEVFTPYFFFLKKTYQNFVESKNTVNQFEKSFSEYDSKRYSNCIGTTGLIMEDYLTQVYETLFRDSCPKSLTLGNLFDLINNKIQKKFEAVQPKELNADDIYEEIKKLTEKENPETKDLLIVIRNLLTFTKNAKKQLSSTIDSLYNKKETLSVFPPRIIENISELIKNRNAISHRSRIPIGEYEAIRSVYCCITLILWWENEKKLIDWKEDPDQIIKGLIARNCKI